MLMKPDDPVVVLAGHGSARDPAAGAATIAAAAALARRGCFHAVGALVKGEPSLAQALRTIAPDRRVLVVPHFAGDGVFATRLIPQIVAEHGRHLENVRILPSLGGSPVVTHHVEALLAHVADAVAEVPDLLVIGHGSAMAAAGDRSADELAQMLGGSAVCRSAHTIFIEHAPVLADWRRLPLGRDIVVCVMLAARGRHAREDVPPAFGLPIGTPLIGPAGEAVGPFVVGGRRLWLYAPLADTQRMADAAEAAVRGALGLGGREATAAA